MESNFGLDSELESFRQEWISEVRVRKNPELGTQAQQTQSCSASQKMMAPSPRARSRPLARTINDEESDHEAESMRNRTLDDMGTPESSAHVLDRSLRSVSPSSSPGKELVSALDHYEEAMEKEAQGNMGDSLKLYRRAYRVRLRREEMKKILPGFIDPLPSMTYR